MAAIARTARRRRRGSVYLAVLGAAMMIGVMALASAGVSRLELRSSTTEFNRREARLLARSAIEFAIAYLENEPTWRADLTNDTLEPAESLGGGSFAFKVVDDDGDLNNGDSDGCTVYGYGYAGNAVAAEAVTLAPTGEPLDCLEVALCVGSGFTLPSGNSPSWNHLYTDQMVAANGAIDASANFANINGDAWASGAIAGTVTGVAYANQGVVRELPGSDVFDYYKANGSWIDVNALPESDGRRRIYHQVLSPATNPYGDRNAEGVYVIDCQGQSVEVSESRIVGTLVLLNNGADSRTDSALCWEPAVANYPALLVENDFTFRHPVVGLSEPIDGVNYNPPGTPIDDAEDNDTSDTHPFRFDGLVYIGGQLRNAQYLGSRVDGCVVCGQLDNDAIATFNYHDTHLFSPPPGFRAGETLRIVPGTWRRVTAD